MLYVRVVGQDDGAVYGCYNLGHILDGFPPDAKFDAGNNLAVLQTIGRREYLFSRIGIDGNFISQSTYASVKGQPFLRESRRRSPATWSAPSARTAGTAGRPRRYPKLSDRPIGLPK